MTTTTSPTERVGRYQLLEPIGVGPSGAVSRAKVFGVAGFERQFAIKRFHAELTSTAAMAAMLSAAARAYGSLEHPRIARMSEFGVAQGSTFTAVEFVAGLDVTRLVAEVKLGRSDAATLPAGGALALVSQAARAVGYAHGRGLTHLGLSPTNVIVTAEGDVKITDFGILAATLPQKPTDVPRLAQRIAYLAPEQLANEATSAATDVFALGVLAYELVTGVRTFKGETPQQIAQSIMAGPPAEPPLPRPIVRVLQRCLARSPFERFPDARALADALDAALRVAPVPGTRKDVGAQVKESLDRVAQLHANEMSGVVALNTGTGPVRKLSDVAEIGPAPALGRDSQETLDLQTHEFVRPDVPVAGPTPLVGPATTLPDLPKIPMTTVPGLAPPPIPVPPGVASPPLGTPAVAPPTTTLLGIATSPRPAPRAPSPPIPPIRPQSSPAVPPPIPPARPSSQHGIPPLPRAPSVDTSKNGEPRAATVRPNEPDEVLTETRPVARGESEPGLGGPTDPVLPVLTLEDETIGPGAVPPPRPPTPQPPRMATMRETARETAEMSPILSEKLNEASTRAITREIEAQVAGLQELPEPPPAGPPSSQPALDALFDPHVEVRAPAGKPPWAGLPTPPAGMPTSWPPTPPAGLPTAPPPSEPVRPRAESPASPFVIPTPPPASAEPLAIVPQPAAGRPTVSHSEKRMMWILVGIAGAVVLGVGIWQAAVRIGGSKGSGSGSGSVAVVAPPPADARVAIARPDAAQVAIATPDAATAAPPHAADAGVHAMITVDAGAAAALPDAAQVAVAPRDAAAVEPHPIPVGPGSASGDTLSITSTPAGARVFLDGADAGATPLKLPGTPDRHTIALLLAGHELYVAQVDGRGAFEIPLKEVTPTNGPAGIKVLRCAKDRYYVFVDGKPTGQTCPTERIGCDVGPHTVEVYDVVSETRRKWDIVVKDTRLSYRVRIE